MAVETPPKSSVYNIANYLTASRLVLGVILFVLIELKLWVPCLIVFALAAVTDWLDGWAARKFHSVGPLGRMFDPLIDKVVVGGAFVLLLDDLPQFLFPWMVVLLISREFIVTGVRGFMEQQGIEFGADNLGKVKMFLQCVVLIAAFLLLALAEGGRIALEPQALLDLSLAIVFRILIYAMVAATALSGLQYLVRAAKDLK